MAGNCTLGATAMALFRRSWLSTQFRNSLNIEIYNCRENTISFGSFLFRQFRRQENALGNRIPSFYLFLFCLRYLCADTPTVSSERNPAEIFGESFSCSLGGLPAFRFMASIRIL